MTGTCQIKLNDVLMFRQSNLKMLSGAPALWLANFGVACVSIACPTQGEHLPLLLNSKQEIWKHLLLQ